MKILITGADGQLGRALQNECSTRGIDFIPTDYIVETNNHSHSSSNRFVNLDITRFEAVRQFVKNHPCEVILNCAAYNDVDKAEKEKETAFLVNAFGPRNLAIVSNELQIPLVHFSTDYVFDGKKGSPYYVWDKPNPLSVYGKSKLYGEEMVTQFTNRYFLVRLSWVFGDGKINFVKKVIEWSKNKEELRIVDDQISSPSYTVDLSKAILGLLHTGEYGVYHLSNTGYCSRYEWAKTALILFGWKGKIIPVKSDEFKTKAKRPNFSAMDNFPLDNILGYELPEWKEATLCYLKESEDIINGPDS